MAAFMIMLQNMGKCGHKMYVAVFKQTSKQANSRKTMYYLHWLGISNAQLVIWLWVASWHNLNCQSWITWKVSTGAHGLLPTELIWGLLDVQIMVEGMGGKPVFQMSPHSSLETHTSSTSLIVSTVWLWVLSVCGIAAGAGSVWACNYAVKFSHW